MRFVIRALDVKGGLLDWAEVHAVPRPGGLFIAPVVGLRSHSAFHSLSIEWPDLDIARSVAIESLPFYRRGDALVWENFICWHVQGQVNVPRPPVTVEASVTLGVPEARLGARSL